MYKIFLKFGQVVFERWEQKQTDKQTR